MLNLLYHRHGCILENLHDSNQILNNNPITTLNNKKDLIILLADRNRGNPNAILNPNQKDDFALRKILALKQCRHVRFGAVKEDKSVHAKFDHTQQLMTISWKVVD